ncbi:MAG TPA: hemolysin family protein [Terriglobia bacterium]|nr:hemolysin family protein [Terriglobia bacterium]
MLSIAEPIAALLLVGALFMVSVLEAAFRAVSRISARRLIESFPAYADTLNTMVERRDETLMALTILIDTVLAANTVFLYAALIQRDMIVMAAPVAFGVTFSLILIFRFLAPRLVAGRNPEAVLMRLFPLFRIAVMGMRPFSSPLSKALQRFQRWEEEMDSGKKEEETSEEEIQAFIDAGQEEGILEPEAGEMVQSIVHFGDKVAREVMTPRIQIVAIDIDAPIQDLLDLIVTKNHARIPVFRGNIDNVEGIIHERDIVGAWRRGEKVTSLRPFVKPAQFIPETKPIDDLLREMKQIGDQMALVVDEYGGVSGVITIEDLVEEIVGEIHEASDIPKSFEESPGTYVVQGSLELAALDDLLGIPFVEDTECTTVAGAVVELFGRMPAPGEHIEHRGVLVDVLEADRRRVHRLRVKAPAPRNGSPAQPAAS